MERVFRKKNPTKPNLHEIHFRIIFNKLKKSKTYLFLEDQIVQVTPMT